MDLSVRCAHCNQTLAEHTPNHKRCPTWAVRKPSVFKPETEDPLQEKPGEYPADPTADATTVDASVRRHFDTPMEDAIVPVADPERTVDRLAQDLGLDDKGDPIDDDEIVF